MTSGDGFAIKSSISQMGNVARTQVKSQQASPTAQPDAGHKLDQEKRLDRIREAEKAEKQHLKNEERDRRRREDGEPDPEDRDPETEPGEEPEPGTLLDTTA